MATPRAPGLQAVATPRSAPSTSSTARRGARAGRRPATVTALSILLAAEAATAIPSGLVMIASPDGSAFGAPADLLAPTPFASWTVPGILLVTCLGLLPLAAAILTWRGRVPGGPAPLLRTLERVTRHRIAWAAAGASAVAILVWIVTQMIMLSSVAALQVVYLVWGAVIGLLTITPSVRRWFALR